MWYQFAFIWFSYNILSIITSALMLYFVWLIILLFRTALWGSPDNVFTDKTNACPLSRQDLCRQRMAVQTSERGDRSEVFHPSHTSRINSMSSQFSDGPMQSPSTRSSTSSWSEEPTQTNMDISTGHMILVNSLIYAYVNTGQRLLNTVPYTTHTLHSLCHCSHNQDEHKHTLYTSKHVPLLLSLSLCFSFTSISHQSLISEFGFVFALKWTAGLHRRWLFWHNGLF